MANSRAGRWGLATLLVLGLVWVLWPKATPKDSARPTTERLRVALDLWPGYYPLIIAQERALLSARGLEVELVFPEDTKGMLADFAAGRYDGICASLGDFIVSSGTGADARFVLVSDESAGADQLIGQARGQENGSWVGARISTALGGFGELLVRRFLKAKGLRPEEVSVVHSDAAEVPSLLRARKIDIGHTWEPYAKRARAEGGVVLFSSADTPRLVLDGLMVKGRWLRERPEQTRALVAAWFDALSWWSRNPQEARELLLRYMRSRHLPVDEISLEGILLYDAAMNREVFAPQAEQGLYAAAAEFGTYFAESGIISEAPPPAQLFDDRFLP